MVAVGVRLGVMVFGMLVGTGEAGAGIGDGVAVEQLTSMKVMKVIMCDFLKVACLILPCAFR